MKSSKSLPMLLGLTVLAAVPAQAQLPVIQTVTDTAADATMIAAPGSQLEILGQNLVLPGATCMATELPLPVTLQPCAFSATVGGAKVAVSRAFSTQATVFLPWDLEPGPAQLVAMVEGVGASEPFDLTIRKYAPAYLFFGLSGSAFYSAITPATSESPARPGQVITTYASGLGNTENDPELGQVGPIDPLGKTWEQPGSSCKGPPMRRLALPKTKARPKQRCL